MKVAVQRTRCKHWIIYTEKREKNSKGPEIYYVFLHNITKRKNKHICKKRNSIISTFKRVGRYICKQKR